MIRHYLKLAIRNLERNKLGSVISISGLILALSCAIIIFLFIEQEVNFNKHHKNYDKLHLIKIFMPDFSYWTNNANYKLKEEIESSLNGFEGISHYGRLNSEIVINQDVIERKSIYGVDTSYFDLFTFETIKGNLKTTVSNANKIAISEEKALKLFGSTNVLNKDIELRFRDTTILFSISAIFKELPKNTDHKPSYIISMAQLKTVVTKSFYEEMPFYFHFVLLNQEQEKTFQEKLSLINGKIKNGSYGVELYIHPYNKLYFSNEPDQTAYFKHGNKNLLFTLGSIGIILLIIASVNYIGYTTSQIDSRSRQSAIQQYVGAKKKQMIFTNLTESILLSLIALPISLIIAEIMIPVINRIYGFNLEIIYAENIQFVVGIISISIITGILAGLYQAILLAKINPINIIRNNKIKTSKSFRKIIIGLQVFMLSSIGIFTYNVYQQYVFAENFNLGFDKENLVYLRSDRSKYEEIDKHWSAFKEEVKQTLGIKSICYIEDNFPGSGYEELYEDHKTETDKKVLVDYMFIEKDFFNTIGLELTGGRLPDNFHADDTIYPAILSQEAIDKLGITDPIGRLYNFYDEPHRIVATFDKLHHKGVKKNNPLILILSPWGALDILIKFESNPSTELQDQIKNIWNTFYPELKMEFESMAETNKKYYKTEKIYQEILLILIILMIVISVSGLYSLSSQLASQRTKEIGVRKVLGAQNNQLKKLLLNEFIPTCIISNLLSIPISIYLLNKWLESYAHHISVNASPFIFSLIISLLIVVASMLLNVTKAAKQNPVDILRNE